MHDLEKLLSVGNSEIEAWPNHWDIHVEKSNDFYFDETRDLPIDIIQSIKNYYYAQPMEKFSVEDAVKTIDRGQVKLQIIYNLYDRFYIANQNLTADEVRGTVFRILTKEEQLGDKNLIIVKAGDKAYSCYGVGNFEADSGYSCAEEVESLISKDYYDNDDIDGGGGGSDDDNSPFDDSPSGLKIQETLEA